MTRLLQSPWLTALVGCLVYLGVTLALFKPSQFVRVSAAQASEDINPDEDPSWRFHNPEFDQWLSDIKHEKEALSTREQELKQLQTRLDSQRQELTSATQTVHQMQEEFDKNVIRIKAQDAENVKRQAKILSTMSPDAAANLVKEMPAADAVRILFTMKVDEASPILETLSKLGATGARQAAALTEMLRHTLPPDPDTH